MNKLESLGLQNNSFEFLGLKNNPFHSKELKGDWLTLFSNRKPELKKNIILYRKWKNHRHLQQSRNWKKLIFVLLK
jgi:hypothetical protein